MIRLVDLAGSMTAIGISDWHTFRNSIVDIAEEMFLDTFHQYQSSYHEETEKKRQSKSRWSYSDIPCKLSDRNSTASYQIFCFFCQPCIQ